MISTRFALILSLMLIAAIVPTVFHSYIGAVVDDGYSAKAVDEKLAGLLSQQTNRREAWVMDTYGSHDWIERRYRDKEGDILLFIARSFDLKRLYHHPEIGVLRGADLEKGNITKLKSLPEVPVHILRGQTGQGLAAYTLLYDDRFVRNPIKVQILSSIKLMFSARKPMTLFMVYDKNADREDGFEQSTAVRVLESAMESFLAQKIESRD